MAFAIVFAVFSLAFAVYLLHKNILCIGKDSKKKSNSAQLDSAIDAAFALEEKLYKNTGKVSHSTDFKIKIKNSDKAYIEVPKKKEKTKKAKKKK